MSFKAKLFIEEEERNVLNASQMYSRFIDVNGRPTSKPVGGLLYFSIESTNNDNFFYNNMFSQTRQCKGEIIFYKRDGLSTLFKIEFANAQILSLNEKFHAIDNQPLHMELSIGWGIMRMRGVIHEKTWNPNNPFEEISPTVIKEEEPTVVDVSWQNDKEEDIQETTYGETIALVVTIDNHDGGTVEVSITKVDGSEFESGKKELTFSESVDVDGKATLSKLEIEKQWEELKKVAVDKLMAKASHNGSVKKSKALSIIPSPKIIVDFRPHDAWKGEFGFDWIRKKDTTLFGDNKYEDIISKQYKDSAHTKLEKDSNKYKGYFKKDAKQFENLKNKYKKFTLPWSKKDKSGKQTPEDYSIPWMSLLKGEEAQINILVKVEEQADYIEFETNSHFTITPNKIDVKGKAKVEYKDNVTVKIKCDQEFKADQVLVVKAYKKGIKNAVEVGKIQVWANDKTKQKEKKVVFVQLKTKVSKTALVNTANATSEKKRIGSYLKQALISLHKDSDIVDLDLRLEKDFLKFVTASNTVNYTNKKDTVQLHDFLKAKLNTDFKDKYKDYFKAFYFAEGGGDSGRLSGYSQPGQEYVVVFSSANDQTASHEFLHALNLAHSFANKEADSNAEFTYQYKQTENLLDYSHHISAHKNDRCSLWYWQWVKANNSI